MMLFPPARISTPAAMAWITISCLEKGDHVGKRVVLPHTFEELKQIGVTTYGAPFIRDGAPFIRVLNEEGAEINDIRVVRKGDRVVFASQKGDEEFTRVTITCSEKGDASGKLLVLPRSLEELKWIGEKIYGAPFVRVLSEEGYEINDIWVLGDGDRIIFARQERPEESLVRVTVTCLEKGDAAGKLVVLPRNLEELKGVGVEIYGTSFARVLSEEGNEINDIRVVKDGDRVVFASHKLAEESFIRVTITCLEKGHDAEKLLVLPRSLEELKCIGVKIYGAPFVRVLSEEGNEINDIRVVRDGDQIAFARQKWANESIVRVVFTCLEKGDDGGKLLRLPRSLKELKGVGVKIYGAPFVRVLSKQGNEINDIREVRGGDLVDFASQKESRVTITCLEKGDAAGKLMVLPRSFEELKWIGVKIYGAPFLRVLSEEGNEINDINVVRDGDGVVFARYKGDEESNAQERAEESNARSNAQKRAEESNTRSNAKKQVEESNEPVTITCLAPFTRVLSLMWCSFRESVEQMKKELRSMT